MMLRYKETFLCPLISSFHFAQVLIYKTTNVLKDTFNHISMQCISNITCYRIGYDKAYKNIKWVRIRMNKTIVLIIVGNDSACNLTEHNTSHLHTIMISTSTQILSSTSIHDVNFARVVGTNSSEIEALEFGPICNNLVYMTEDFMLRVNKMFCHDVNHKLLLGALFSKDFGCFAWLAMKC